MRLFSGYGGGFDGAVGFYPCAVADQYDGDTVGAAYTEKSCLGRKWYLRALHQK